MCLSAVILKRNVLVGFRVAQYVACCVLFYGSLCFSPFLALFSLMLYVLQFTKEQVYLLLALLYGLINNGFIGIFHGVY